MHKKLLVISLLTISAFLLTGCTNKELDSNKEQSSEPSSGAENGIPDSSGIDEKESVSLNQVFSAVEAVTTLTDAQQMVIRKKVDDIYLNGEGEGYTIRMAKDNLEFPKMTTGVDQALSSLGFSKKEYTPKNMESFVTKYIKYIKGDLECTLEIRDVGKTTGNSDFTFGCY